MSAAIEAHVNYASEQNGNDTSAPKKDIFLLINRRGFATASICKDCGYSQNCPTCDLPLVYQAEAKKLVCHYCKTQNTVPTACPKCQSPFIIFQGVGTELVEHHVRTLIETTRAALSGNLTPSLQYDIIRLEGDDVKSPVNDEQPRIIIGTEAALPHIRWDKTALVGLLDLDRQLALPEYTANEQVWQLIQEIQYRKSPECSVYIQTRRSDHFVYRSLLEPDRFYRTELNQRRAAGYPPYTYLTRYLHCQVNPHQAQRAAHELMDQLQSTLTKTPKNIKLQGPLELQPRYYRRQYWYTIIAKGAPGTWLEDTLWLNQHIPDNWKIDPNPHSLLSH